MDKALPHETAMMQDIAIEGIIKGYSTEELFDQISKQYPHIEEDEVRKNIKRSTSKIRDNVLTDIDKIIPLHIELYEQIYQQFDHLRFVPGKVKAMQKKEKLIGLHRENTSVEVHNQVDIDIETQAEYDLSKLSIDQQKRLSALMQRIEVSKAKQIGN